VSKLDRNIPGDIVWAEAQIAFSREPHPPTRMVSLQSLGPVKDWVCPICAQWGVVATAYSRTTEPPWCDGGGEYL